MSKVPMGKVLLRNVIRHTDAHNKIQEESEMWKMRDWEKQTSYQKPMPATEFMRGSMHCDRVSNNSREQIPRKDRTSGHDDREARYWSRKLYEFEANDPDRWGHSGFKELYPEEFKSDSEEDGGIKNNGHHKMKTCGLGTAVSKRSKKSSRKKKKKKKSKKEEKRRRAEGSSSDGSSDESNDTKCKKRRKGTKSKHKNKKRKTRGREEDSSSEESDDEGDGDRRTHSHKKRKRDSHKGTDSGVDSQKKKRKNWKAPNEENSDDSSGD
ncbi:uncharacterized protein NKAPD1 [Polymixia lowei]